MDRVGMLLRGMMARSHLINCCFRMREIMPNFWCPPGGVLAEKMQSVLNGGVGCSTPISDTTILSALATKCDLPAHVITQLPYALTVGIFAALLGKHLSKITALKKL